MNEDKVRRINCPSCGYSVRAPDDMVYQDSIELGKPGERVKVYTDFSDHGLTQDKLKQAWASIEFWNKMVNKEVTEDGGNTEG